MIERSAAIAAALVLAGLVAFQLLLASGRPLGHYAWGGAHRVLPRPLRIASVASCLVYVLAALAILETASVIDLVPSNELPRSVTWALAVLFAVGIVMNAVSRSTGERRMAAVALVLSVLSVVVASRV